MTNPVYAFNAQDGVATLTVTALADIKKLAVVRTAEGYAVQYASSPLKIDDKEVVLDSAAKKVRFVLQVGALESIQAEIDLGLNIGQVDKQDPNAAKDSATTSWGALLKDQFHFVWVNGTSGNETFDFASSPDISEGTRGLMSQYQRGIWVDLKTGDDTAVGSPYGDNFSIAGSGVRYIDGGGNAGSPPWGGKATDTVDVFVGSNDTVSVEELNDGSGYTHILLINKGVTDKEVKAHLKNIENVNIQIWNDTDLNGERDWGKEVQWVRNIQLAINVNEVKVDPADPTKADWGTKLEDMWHLAWINGTKGQDTIDASTLVSPANKELQGAYKHGVWIDAAEGNDTITGTDYSDNIKGGAGVDKIDGGKHLASTGQRGQDVFEIDLTTDNFSSAQLLLSTVKISQVSEKDPDGTGYTWMIEVGTIKRIISKTSRRFQSPSAMQTTIGSRANGSTLP